MNAGPRLSVTACWTPSPRLAAQSLQTPAGLALDSGRGPRSRRVSPNVAAVSLYYMYGTLCLGKQACEKPCMSQKYSCQHAWYDTASSQLTHKIHSSIRTTSIKLPVMQERQTPSSPLTTATLLRVTMATLPHTPL